MKRFLRGMLFIALCISLPLSAQAGPEEARQFVKRVGDDALAIVGSSKIPEKAKMAKLESLFVQHVDIEWVAKFVLGRYWRQATPEQQQRYLANYRTFLIKHYTSRFAEYTNESFNVTQAKADGAPGEYQLTMEIVRPGKENINVDYRVRENGKQFRIFDIIVEGVSLITTQRSEFASVVARDGLDTLIDQLKTKTDSLLAHNKGEDE